MKIKQVYCPHCDERFEWFDPDVSPNDVGILAGGLVGGIATPALVSGMGITLVGGLPSVLLGLVLGGLIGNVVGESVGAKAAPCPRCGPGEPPQGRNPIPQTDAETQPNVCQISVYS